MYPITDVNVQKGTQPLDPNHSHFILVDDGSRNTFGGEIKWRADFEKFLTQHVLSDSKGRKRLFVAIYIYTLSIALRLPENNEDCLLNMADPLQ